MVCSRGNLLDMLGSQESQVSLVLSGSVAAVPAQVTWVPRQLAERSTEGMR